MPTPIPLVALLMSLAACSDELEPTAAPPPEPVPEAPAKPAKPEPPPRAPLPPAVPVAGYETVAVVGFGVRLELNPPFQAAIMPMRRDDGQRLVVSWWDVNAEGAATRGRAGLHNTIILPGDIVPGAKPTPAIDEDDNPILRVGGTVVRLPTGASSLGGAMTVLPGPPDEVWRVTVGAAAPVDWPERTMLHSEDPATGSSMAFKKRPEKPFGPW